MSSWVGRAIAAPRRTCHCGRDMHARGLCMTHYARDRYRREREDRSIARRLERELLRRRVLPPGVLTTYCGNCGTPATLAGHRDAWRDEGHAPFLVREAA